MKTVIFIVVFLSHVQWINGQDIFWTEEEIGLQRTYIEANTQKILGNIDKALPLYQKVVKEKRSLHPAWYEIARMQHASDDNEAALISINKAIKFSPENKWYTLFKVDLNEKMGNTDDAAQALVDYFKTNEYDQNLLERLGYIYAQSFKVDKALDVYDQLETKYGIHESYSKKKYNLYIKQNRDDLAILEIKKLIQAYPYNIGYMHLLAGNLLQLGETKEAEEIFTRILRIDPDDTKASIAMAQTYREDGKSSEFIKSISSIISNPNLDVDIKIQELIPPLNKLVSEYNSELSEELIHAAKLVLKAHPNEPKAFAMASDIYFHSGKYGEARSHYEKTLELNNTVYPVWEQYLYTLVILNDPTEILKSVESALNIFPNQGRLYYFEALAYYKLNDFDAAHSAASHAELISRKNPDLKQYILILKSVLAAAQSDAPKTKTLLKSAIDIDPDQTDHLLNNFIEDLNKNDNSNLINHALSELKFKNTPSALFSSALSSYLSGDLDRAAQSIQKAMSGTPYNIPKFLDLYLAIQEGQSSTAAPHYAIYSDFLKEMGYRRMFNKDNP